MQINKPLITQPLDDGLLVARPGGHRLFIMNASARFMWELLDGLRGLGAAPVRRRYGEEVRYLAPDCTQVAQTRLPVRAIVFLERGAGRGEELRPLTQLEGLQRMLAAPATIKGPMSEEMLARLIRWSAAIAFHHLPYGTPEQGAAAVEALLAE